MEVEGLEEKVKLQQDELDELERHLEEKRLQVKSLENVEVQLKSQLSSLGLSGAVSSWKEELTLDRRSSKSDLISSMEFEREGKYSKSKVEVSSRQLQSTPASKSSGKGGSHGQGPLSSAFYKGMATSGPSTNMSKNDFITGFGDFARNNSRGRHFPPANSS